MWGPLYLGNEDLRSDHPNALGQHQWVYGGAVGQSDLGRLMIDIVLDVPRGGHGRLAPIDQR